MSLTGDSQADAGLPVRPRHPSTPSDPIGVNGGGVNRGGAFDRWSQAALVLDGSGRVVVMNRLADELLQRSDGLSLGADARLRSIDAAAGARLEAAIGRFAAMEDAGDRQPDPDGISLPRLSGGQAFRAVITPLPFLGSAGSGAHGPGSVLLVIVDPARVRRTPSAWIARQFGLTPAEQSLTEAVVNGVTLADAAEQLGIRLSTARNRLKIIQAKTQCRRQVDLVRLAFSLPAARQD